MNWYLLNNPTPLSQTLHYLRTQGQLSQEDMIYSVCHKQIIYANAYLDVNAKKIFILLYIYILSKTVASSKYFGIEFLYHIRQNKFEFCSDIDQKTVLVKQGTSNEFINYLRVKRILSYVSSI